MHLYLQHLLLFILCFYNHTLLDLLPKQSGFVSYDFDHIEDECVSASNGE